MAKRGYQTRGKTIEGLKDRKFKPDIQQTTGVDPDSLSREQRVGLADTALRSATQVAQDQVQAQRDITGAAIQAEASVDMDRGTTKRNGQTQRGETRRAREERRKAVRVQRSQDDAAIEVQHSMDDAFIEGERAKSRGKIALGVGGALLGLGLVFGAPSIVDAAKPASVTTVTDNDKIQDSRTFSFTEEFAEANPDIISDAQNLCGGMSPASLNMSQTEIDALIKAGVLPAGSTINDDDTFSGTCTVEITPKK
jgi:hypothetical protein